MFASLPTCPPGTERFPSSQVPRLAAGLSLLRGKVAGPLVLTRHSLGSPGGLKLRDRVASSNFQSQNPRNRVMGVLLPDTLSEWRGWPRGLSPLAKARQEVRELSGRHGCPPHPTISRRLGNSGSKLAHLPGLLQAA